MQVPFNLPDTQVDNRIPVQVHGFHYFKYSSSVKKEKETHRCLFINHFSQSVRFALFDSIDLQQRHERIVRL